MSFTHAERTAWLRENFRGPKGDAFESREWVEEHLWTPLDGWRLAAVNVKRLCGECQDRVGKIIPWDWGTHDGFRAHVEATPGCDGLRFRPILLIAISLKRRNGKTFTTAATLLHSVCWEQRRDILFCASVGDQSEKLWRENFLSPIEQNAKLKKACRVVGNRIVVDRTRSKLTYAQSSAPIPIAGSSYTAIFFDECKGIPAETFVAAAMSIQDSGGYRCAKDALHFNRPGLRDDGFEKIVCPRCGTLCEPWAPKLVLASTQGEDKVEAEGRWFNDLVAALLERCPDNYYVFYSTDDLNPAVYREVTNGLIEGLSQIEGLKTFVAIEADNVRHKKGEDFVSVADIKRRTDDDYVSLDASTLECVAFLDTSWVRDLTTLMIYGWDPASSTRPWQVLVPLHHRIWDPKADGQRMRMEPVLEHFDQVVPMFPNLQLLLADDRGSAWTRDLISECQRNRRGWGQKVRAFHARKDAPKAEQLLTVPGIGAGQAFDRNLAWRLFEQRMFSGTIWLPPLPRIEQELRGVQRKPTADGGYEIVDRNRKRVHVDVVEAIVGCCLVAFHCGAKPKGRTLTEVEGMQSRLAALLGREQGPGWDSSRNL